MSLHIDKWLLAALLWGATAEGATVGMANGRMALEGTGVDLLVVEKHSRRLYVYAHGRLLKSYSVALGPHPLGPKFRNGDGRTPEGRYYIDGHNASSAYHLSLHISYPSDTDIERARAAGFAPGGNIMIHGYPNDIRMLGGTQLARDWTAGCIALTNNEIEELYQAVGDGTVVDIRP